MSIKKKASDYANNLYHTPPNENDLAEFGRLIIEEFTQQLKANTMSVAWNYGLDSVLFVDRNLDDRLCLDEIKERFINGIKSNESDTDGSDGAGTDRSSAGDKETRGYNKLNEDKGQADQGSQQETT